MHFHFYNRFNFRAAFVIIVLFTTISLPLYAQNGSRGINADGDVLGGSSYNSGGYGLRDSWMIALNGGYESPLGDLKDIYKGAATFGLNVRKRMGNLVYSGTIDYRAYKPRQRSFAYTVDDVNYFTAAYSNYTGAGIYLGIAYELPVSGLVSVYGGINGGFILTKFKLSGQDDDGSTYFSQSATDQTTYIAPKAGFNILVSENISIGIEAKYSIGIAGANYNTRDGGSVTRAFNSYAGNLFLIYSF